MTRVAARFPCEDGTVITSETIPLRSFVLALLPKRWEHSLCEVICHAFARTFAPSAKRGLMPLISSSIDDDVDEL